MVQDLLSFLKVGYSIGHVSEVGFGHGFRLTGVESEKHPGRRLFEQEFSDSGQLNWRMMVCLVCICTILDILGNSGYLTRCTNYTWSTETRRNPRLSKKHRVFQQNPRYFSPILKVRVRYGLVRVKYGLSTG